MSITTRRIATRIATGLATTATVAAISLGGASAASASQFTSVTLAPGQGVCTAPQYAGYQVRADGTATGQGAKFKLQRNGFVVVNTPNRANYWAAELRSSYGTFPGSGSYQACAQNTGTAYTTVSLQLRTDGEF
jgi:hypothetical protein